MTNVLRFMSVVLLALGFSIQAISQSSVTISGSVKNGKTKETVSAVSVSVKGAQTGTYTDDNGNFKFTTNKKLPITLVISSVGFATKEVTVSSAGTAVAVEVEPSFELGQDVVVSASRTPERILESPVTIERVNAAAIRNSPAASYYDIVGNLKGVDVMTSSLTFRTPTTRGFQGSGNLRMNQLIDGMDNQAPGLNFSVGGFVGPNELDVESMELLPGASSALYGSGGMNGTLLINSKDPFKYQGFSFQVKQGALHVDNFQRNMSPYHDWSFRWAKKVNERLAFKIGAQFVQARDWLANDLRNYNRTTSANPNGNVIGGNRGTDPNYDGVNVYGDETTSSLNAVYNGVLAQIPGGANGPLFAASNSYLTAFPNNTLAQYNGFLTSIGAGALVTGGASGIMFGGHPSRGFFNGVNVSRTGYNEIDVVNPNTVNFRASAAVHYKIKEGIEASLSTNFGTGNTVYTGSDRYSLLNLRMAQHKLEIKGDNWFIRGYTTQENSGDSYNATIATRLFNEAWKASPTWYAQYAGALVGALSAQNINNAAGFAAAQAAQLQGAHGAARGFADVGRPTGSLVNNPLFERIVQTPIGRGGGLFVDRSDLYVGEAQYNFTKLLGLEKYGADFLVGVTHREFWLDSRGTLFADTTGRIRIRETGGYAQLQKKLFNDRLKLSVSGRYDKNENFAGRFTPRVSAVVKLAKDHNLRFSYQTAYRFPSTQNQWIDLEVSGGTFLIGGLPQLRDFYKFNSNPVYTVENVTRYGGAIVQSLASQGVTNPANATPAQLATAVAAGNALLTPVQFGEFKPEIANSYEIGYKGQWFGKILVDVYAYQSNYQNFIGQQNVIQSNLRNFSQITGNPAAAPFANLGLINAFPAFALQAVGLPGNVQQRNVYATSVNSQADVTIRGFGASAEYKLPKNYSFGANLFSDEITDAPAGFVTFFNTPRLRYNLMFSNSGLGKSKRIGFNITYRWQEEFTYEGTFGQGLVPAFNTVDAMVSYRLPEIKSMIKLGGTNIMNKYYRSGWGNPQVGALYYVSFAYNVF
ncbi:MAG: TonB-dependent receptor [Bacteroidetes bacterium]|nr:MAG: TonB-dependent receptor [Bacteroidota bacterium]